MRSGIGYDIHRLRKGRKLYLGGVLIPHDRGLAGHSDADAALHALCDAMLGAAGLKDIGYHFPDTDRRFKNVSSLKLLEHTGKLVKKAGFRLNNADITIIAERPKISAYADGMKKAIAAALGVKPGCIGIKATTNEGVGEIGRGKAISACAIATLKGKNK